MNRSDGKVAPEARRGLYFGLAAYGLWGVLPIYFKAVDQVPAIDIVAHRIIWSIPFLALLLSIGTGWRDVRQTLADRRTLALLLLTSALIAVNWLLYVYA